MSLRSILIKLTRKSKKARKFVRAELLRKDDDSTFIDIDPPNCDCTHCLRGITRPAVDYDEYVLAENLGIAR